MAARVPAGGRRERRTRWLMLGVLVLGLALWEAGVAVGLVPAFFLPPPSRVVRALVALAASGELWRHTSATLLRVGEGVLLGCVPAGVIGLAMGWWPRMRTALDPVVTSRTFTAAEIVEGTLSLKVNSATSRFHRVELRNPAGEVRVCPDCGYRRGFHFTFLANDGGSREAVLCCPECGARFDVGWCVRL